MMEGDVNLEKVANEHMLKWAMFPRDLNKMRD